jgi:hypothetical protein
VAIGNNILAMNEDIIDEIINDEVEKNTTQVEVPFGYGRVIVCKPTLVNNSKQLIHKIAVALHQALICDVKECDSKEKQCIRNFNRTNEKGSQNTDGRFAKCFARIDRKAFKNRRICRDSNIS